MRLVNMTPHPVKLVGPGDEYSMTLEFSGTIPRVNDRTTPVGHLDLGNGGQLGLTQPVPILYVEAGEVMDLPDPRPDVLLLVSRITAEAAPDRADLVFPHEMVRDEKGRVVGCKALGTVCPSMVERATSIRPA